MSHRYQVLFSQGSRDVSASSEDRAKGTATRAERLLGRKGRIVVVGVRDLGHLGTDQRDCELCKGKS